MKKLNGKRLAAAVMAGCLAFGSIPVYAANTTGNYAQARTQITDLTTEYVTNPIGIDPDSIHFGWKMQSNVIGAEQTAYQINVSKGEALVWDSGRIESSASVGITYGGDTLEEGTAYTWKVSVWNGYGEKTESEAATFETGVTSQKDWAETEFIRMNRSARAPIFRTEQELLEGSEVASARLYITAMGVYQAYVNGNQVGIQNGDKTEYHHMNPGYGNGQVSLGYQTYDVTPYLKDQGSAALSILAGTGWYNGMGSTASQPAVKAMMKITYEGGEVQTIKTNTVDWKGTLDGPITGNGVYYGEDYNAQMAEMLGDFTQAGYDDSQWADGEEKVQIPVIENDFAVQSAKHVRLLVKETGPAVKDDKENRLQIMELELLDENGKNVAVNASADASDKAVNNTQWNPGNLVDGDTGMDSDKGYTSDILGSSQNTVQLAEPISITLSFEEPVSFQTLKMYPRLGKEPISGKECVNYPKTYCLQVSENGTDWTNVDIPGAASSQTEGESWYTVQSLQNTIAYPADVETSIHTGFITPVTAKDLRIRVSEIGPAGQDSETLLQIMELELLDAAGNNLAAGLLPTASNHWEPVAQWNVARLTDGDLGIVSDAGYTSQVLDRSGLSSLKLDTPITLDFKFDKAVEISSMKIYPRTKQDSIVSGICSNYPKVFSVQTSEDGGETWTDVLTDVDAGQVKNTSMFGAQRLSTASFAGEIRAQEGMPGRILDQYSKTPVSAVLYTGQAEESSYAGGEIAVDRYIAHENSEDPLYSGKFEKAQGDNIFGKDGITLKKGQTMILNMGQNMTAIPEAEFSGKAGTVLTMQFAEMLNDGSTAGNGATQADGPKGSLYQKSLRSARSAVRYTFAGREREHYQTATSFFGYQYVGITATDDVTIYSLRSRALSSVSDQTGYIETNNENVNKLFSNTLYGQLSNYFTTSTDCPQRDERLLWTGDTQAFAQTAVYNFDSVPFLNGLQEVFSENAWIKGYAPAVADDLGGFFSNWAAGWSDVLVIDPWTLYLQTGDKGILEKNWDVMVHYMDYLQNNERGADQAPIPNNARNFGDWLSFQGTSVEVIYDYYYGYMAQLMEKMAKLVGDQEKEAAYAQKFQAIKEKFLKTHVTFTNGSLTIKSGEGNKDYQFMYSAGKGGVWENNSQTSLLWMLKLGFYDSEAMREAAADLLVRNIRNENPDAGSIRSQYGKNTLATGFLGSNVITPVLSDIGSSDVSYDLLLQDSQPSWLFEVKAGATTIWERWNSYTPGVGFGDSEMNSFNHYAYGSVVEWMYRYMAGIASDENAPGFKNTVLQPTLDKGEKYNGEERIHSVDASYDSYYGEIKSSWRSQDGRLTSYQTVVPANTTATLYLPVEESAVSKFKSMTGVTYRGMTEHNGTRTAEFSLASGGYDFTVKDGRLSAAYSEGYTGGDEPQPAVTGVKVSPSEAIVEKGRTQQFEAEVSGENSPSQAVTWSVKGAASKDTGITQEGLLTVGEDETAKELTVTAVSVMDTGRSGTAKVTVTGKTIVTPPEEVKVSSITVKASDSRIFVNDTTVVQAAVLPADAANKQVIWTSSDNSVASVDARGIVTGKKAGSVTITAAASDGSQVKGSCTIRVVKPTVKLNVKSAKLQVKKSTKAIKASGLQAGDRIEKWTSSKKSVATVDNKGKIRARKTGTTKITVYTQKGAKAVMKLTVTKKPVKTASIKADVKKLTLKKGGSYQLQVTRKPVTALDKITYKSSKKSVAVVSNKGKIRAKKRGKAVITIRTANGKRFIVKVTVK